MVRKVLIIGGGIGGLTATLALRQAGFDVQIFEAVPEIKVVGAGLAIWSNALKALRQIGLANAIQAAGKPAAYRVIRAESGELLAKVQVDQIDNRENTALIHLHRGNLQTVLLKAVKESTIQLGARCIGFRQDDKSVWAQFADGREVQGDLLVGADGVHSMIRQQLFSKVRLCLVGQSSWRGLAQIDDVQLLEGGAGETWGIGQRIGLIPMSHGRVYWFLTRNAPPGGGIEGSADERKHHLLESVKAWHEPIPSMVQATEAQTIIHTELNELEPLDQWHRGRVVLLGDAAHAMTPNLGQGACQAIEDAVTLGQCLKATDDVAAALNLYESKRVERARRVVADSRRFGAVVHDEAAPPCLLRGAPFQEIFRSIYVDPLRWIVGHNGDIHRE
jgi:2-polyprenyl-6-methoxyphenol hydroxylase-like FAD-dependent oxidoreductase